MTNQKRAVLLTTVQHVQEKDLVEEACPAMKLGLDFSRRNDTADKAWLGLISKA